MGSIEYYLEILQLQYLPHKPFNYGNLVQW